MRKRYRVLVLAAIGAALIVPVGFALSLESTTFSMAHASASAAVASPILAGTNPAVDATLHPYLPDAAKLLLVGTSLFGLAAFLRRSA